MNKKRLIALLTLIALLGAAGYGIYDLGMRQGAAIHTATNPVAGASTHGAPVPAALPQSAEEGEAATRRHISAGIKAGDTDPANGRRILYYQDPMVPGNKFDKPGKSPFMDMLLVPVYADGDTDQGQVTVSARMQQNLGMRTAPVTEGSLSPQVSAVGTIAFNERDQVIVQARTTAYVERLHVRATLDRVGKSQPLVDLYVPEWVAAQEEFLALKRMQGPDLAPLVDGARQRMRQAGMSEEQIRHVEASGQTQTRITLTAPIGGVVTELLAREGMTVMAGATLFRINGLSTVWANAEVPESQSAGLRPGAKVEAQSPAAPGAIFTGKVQAILPEVDPATRTIKVRLELANPGARLLPGMFVSMQVKDTQTRKAVLVPTEAVIQTGKRAVVMLAEDKGRFRPVGVELGIESGGQTEIKRGLQAGQQVVVSSQFLIDSEASLKGVEARLNAASQPPAADTSARHEGQARVEAIDKDTITLSHGPIPSLKWGPMTMDFKLPPRDKLAERLKEGDRVTFEFYMEPDGVAQLTRIAPLVSGTQPTGDKK
jgi:Cu(I)/Ag(I) efflux system membrane fusion protein